MITINGQYQLAEVQAAQKLHTRRIVRIFWFIIIMMAAFPIVTQQFDGRALFWLLLLPCLALIIGLAVGQRFLLLRQAAHAFAQQKDLSAPFTIEMTDEKFHMRNELGNSHIPWGDFVKWAENDEFLLLYRSNMLFHMLPKRLFDNPDEVDFVLERLRENSVPDRGSLFLAHGK
ncbi:MAG: YcxB family protein [Chloroflexota bacterium]